MEIHSLEHMDHIRAVMQKVTNRKLGKTDEGNSIIPDHTVQHSQEYLIRFAMVERGMTEDKAVSWANGWMMADSRLRNKKS